MNASRDAFLFSVQRLHAETGKLYMWTFTFRKAQDDDVAVKKWRKFCENGYRDFQGIHGLRVVELHDSHGIHFHLLLNQRFKIRQMLALAWPFGFGKIHVKVADIGSARYLAKYLTKQYQQRSFFGKRRRWGAFGGFKPCRCKDVEYDSAYTRNKFLLPPDPTYNQRMILTSFCAYGDFANWPEQIKKQFRQALSQRGNLAANVDASPANLLKSL